MERKQPLTFEQFEMYLEVIKSDFDYFDACGMLGLELVDKVSSPDAIIQLITDLFEDKDDWLSWYIFEKNWGQDKEMKAFNEDKSVIPTDTPADIYKILSENYEKIHME